MALEAAKNERTTAALAREYGVHANQVGAWKRQFLENAAGLFETAATKRHDNEEEVKELLAKIGGLVLEHNFLAGKLSR